ncbi:MAG: hypothetical protein WD077_04695 [Bacteroidia bacterium]
MDTDPDRKLRDSTLLLLSFIIMLFLVCFAALLSFNGLYGQDSYEYLRLSRQLHSVICCAGDPGHFYWPVMYPLAGALFSFILPAPFALQWVSILSFALAFFYLAKLMILLFPRIQWQAVIYLLLFFVLSPFMLRSAAVSMSESLAIFAIMAALYYFFRYKKLLRWNDSMLFALFVSVAITTRYPSFIVLIIPCILIVFLILKKRKYGHLVLMAVTWMLVLLPELFIKGIEFRQFSGNDLFSRWSFSNYFQTSFSTLDGLNEYALPNIIYSAVHLWHPGFLFAGIFWLVFVRKTEIKNKNIIILITIWFLNFFFLAGIPTQNARLFFLTFPMLLIILLPAFIRLQEWICQKLSLRFSVLAAIILVAQLGLFARAVDPFVQYNRMEQSIAGELHDFPARNLYTFSINGPLTAYEVPQKIYNLQLQDIDQANTNDYVLFNLDFEEQWKNQPVWQHWQELNEKFALKPVHSFQNGWILYELQ